MPEMLQKSISGETATFSTNRFIWLEFNIAKKFVLHDQNKISFFVIFFLMKASERGRNVKGF